MSKKQKKKDAHELPCGAGGFVLFLLFTHDSNLQS